MVGHDYDLCFVFRNWTERRKFDKANNKKKVKKMLEQRKKEAKKKVEGEKNAQKSGANESLSLSKSTQLITIPVIEMQNTNKEQEVSNFAVYLVE